MGVQDSGFGILDPGLRVLNLGSVIKLLIDIQVNLKVQQK